LQGITGVTARMAEIQSRMVALATANPVDGASGATRSTSTTPAASTSGTAFASALADAVAATDSTAALTGAKKVSGSHSVNGKGIPTELAAYGNGKIPANALEKVGNTGHRLWAPAAQSLENMLAAAKKDGVRIGITDSYRPYAEQVDLARRKGLYSQGGLAAKPGTSDHGWGMAVDLDLNAKAQAWMRRHGKEYGFEEDTPREPWHWGFKP
jgi:LAS superfamily LD-carboxypeptidase LdcB